VAGLSIVDWLVGWPAVLLVIWDHAE